MNELIDRQAAIDALCGMRLSDDRSDDEKGVFQLSLTLAVGVLRELPSAHPKKGKWIYQMGMIKCDQCLRAIRRIDHDGLLNFCPNCGARMGGGDS